MMKAAALILLAAAAPIHASFLAIYPQVYYDPATALVTFRIEFNQVPDFQTVDSVGRQANEFQFKILSGVGARGSLESYDAIVRGGEIHTSGMIVIRAPGPLRTDGPWGAERAEVPFALDGRVVTFSAPIEFVAPSHLNGRFEYQLMVGDYGGSNQDMRLTTFVAGDVPEPGTLAAMLVAALLALAHWCTPRFGAAKTKGQLGSLIAVPAASNGLPGDR